jgi:hypothetical protein
MNKQGLHLTVIAKGEACTHLSTFNVKQLDKLVKRSHHKSSLVYQLGDLLATKPENYTSQWSQSVEEVLALYTATTDTYKIIRKLEFKTIVFTVFEVDEAGGKVYQACVAGTESENYDDIEFTFESRSKNKINDVVISFFQGSMNLHNGSYSKDSAFHQLRSEAQSLHGKMRYKN